MRLAIRWSMLAVVYWTMFFILTVGLRALWR
jgi:hypothetical protein